MCVVRWFTAIALIGVCGISIAQGWNIVRFSLATANNGSLNKTTDVIDKWTGVPGLASAALRAELSDETNLSDPKAANRRRELISAILSIQPMLSIDWLTLSRMQLAAGQSINQVVGSYRLSVLTGPNEASIMAERGIYGVSLWDSLPQILKSHVAVDLGPVIAPRTPAEAEMRDKAWAVISAETDRVRKELQQALLATGLSRQEIRQRLGL